MKVTIVEPSGFCSGVSNAFKLAKEVRELHPNKKIVVLGMLVHNEDALKELEEYHIDTMYKKDVSYVDMVDMLKGDEIVVLTAHGHPKEIEDKLNQRGIIYYDATCPFVKLAHNEILKNIKENHQVIYIGKKNHPEALSALSLSKDVLLYEIKDGMNKAYLKDESPLLISQTTFSKRDVEVIEKTLKNDVPSLRFAKSVCNASLLRQEALLNISKDVDAIYIVGGKESNNTKTLYNLALINFPKTKVFYIQNKDDIKEKDLIGLSNVAIISGTSSPRYILEEIKAKLKSI